jgi:hypothetical protein
MPAAMASKDALPAPRRLQGVLEPSLFASFQLYLRALARTEALVFEEWGQRRIRHNDPVAALIHHTLTPLVAGAVAREVKPSYSFLACYAEGSRVPAHRDRAQCRYTLDLCVDDGGYAEPWPLFIEDRAYAFGPNEAVVYLGCDQTHYRQVRPAGSPAHLAFFHFVDVDFAGSLD